MTRPASRRALFVCEKYYLRFYAPVAERLRRSGIAAVWIAVDGPAPWDHAVLDPTPAIDALAEDDLRVQDDVDAICRFEHAVFDRPSIFTANYPYIFNHVRTLERARRLASAWYHATMALLDRFDPVAVFVWNGRYLPYSAVSAACESAAAPLLTSEIGWVPGTIFLDRGRLSPDTTDLAGRRFDTQASADPGRADAFLEDYRARKATMVSQALVAPAEARRRLLGNDGTFLLLYGCQVDWDTNVVIGARRFHSNEAALSFLMACAAAVPGARIVVKTHPLDSETDHHRLQELVGSRGVVVTDIHPHTLIEAADCVAVRNSTLGFEALCYGKPVIALEPAKYSHPSLTLAAGSVGEGSADLLRVSRQECRLPDPTTLRRFVLHALDHYLVPVGYEYFFEPEQLALLSHLAANDSAAELERLLHHAGALAITADDRARQLIGQCAVSSPGYARRLARRLGRLAGRRR